MVRVTKKAGSPFETCAAICPGIEEDGGSPANISDGWTRQRLSISALIITRIAFEFRCIPALIALKILSLGGHRPALPDRNWPRTETPPARVPSRAIDCVVVFPDCLLRIW